MAKSTKTDRWLVVAAYGCWFFVAALVGASHFLIQDSFWQGVVIVGVILLDLAVYIVVIEICRRRGIWG